jgi:hypothetical protein
MLDGELPNNAGLGDAIELAGSTGHEPLAKRFVLAKEQENNHLLRSRGSSAS